jgi:heme-degrading monooxygenase HmoA
MFSVIFEVHPRPERSDTYLEAAKMLRPELEKVDGFIDNVRYRSLTREGWILSLSSWRDEKALVRWRTAARHHDVQQRGRDEILLDYHLRVGQLTRDTQLPSGCELREQRLDETEVGEGTAVTFVSTALNPMERRDLAPELVARQLGLPEKAAGLLGWDVFEAVLTPGELILMLVWADQHAKDRQRQSAEWPDELRERDVRVIRDYGMFDRREAPQYYASALDRR